MVLESLRPTTSGGRHPACVIRSFDNARVVQERMQRQARLAFAEPQPTLAEHFPNALQRYEIYRALPNFDPRFGAILMRNSSKSLTLGKTHARHGFALA